MKYLIVSVPWLLAVLLSLYSISGNCQSSLQSGPMLGYNEMKEVQIWLQTRSSAKVGIAFWEKDSTGIPANKQQTETIITQAFNGFTAKLTATHLQPGTQYEYEVLVDEKIQDVGRPLTFTTQPLWQHRTDPPNFRVALGSCNYINDPPDDRPGEPYGGDYRIFRSILAKEPDIMLWLGDNVYLREADWGSRSGFIHRYTHTRSLPELQPLWSAMHHYAIWDDHDFGPNDANGSFIHKDWALEFFEYFWANNGFGLPGQKGTTNQFQYMDIDFFLLDNRYNRSPNQMRSGGKTMLGQAQLEWLIQALVTSRSPFKMVALGGQFLNPAKVHENYAHFFPAEREYLIKRITEEEISGVIFLTGDRHHTELSKLKLGNDHKIYELTISPLTSGLAGSDASEANTLRVDDTFVRQRNFGLLEIKGRPNKRKLKIHVYNADGKLLWNKTLKASKL